MVYLAADHRGFALKEHIKKTLSERGIVTEDCGVTSYEDGDDYTDFAAAAAKKIAANPAERKGIFLCGSGHGVDIVANKFRGIRAALCWNAQVAKQSREHEDANVLALPADWIDEKQAEEIVQAWLDTRFSGAERHARRVHELERIEKENFHG